MGVLASVATCRPLRDVAACHDCPVRERAFCRALAPGQLPGLSAITTEIGIESGRTLFYEGDEAPHVFNVRRGMVKLFKLLGDGRRQITGFLVPGDFLGLAYGDRYVYGAEAVVDSQLCRFGRDRLDRLIDLVPAIERELLGRAADELAVAQDQMLLLGRKSAAERLATFLLMMARRGGSDGAPPTRVPLPMCRLDIADYLGLSIETVSRTFTALRKAGLVELPTSAVVVLRDPDALVALAGS
jgi:CRP/FNR family transcriptional regulator, anaerobic regulatory protein